MKRSLHSASMPTIPRARALPPQRRRLVDVPGLLPSLRVATALVLTAMTVGGAAAVVMGVERGSLQPIVIPLLSLAVLVATAAYFAGRSEGLRQHGSADDRRQTQGRIAKRAGAKRSDPSAAGAQRDAVRRDGEDAASASDAAAAGLGGAVLRTKFLDDISQALRAPITSICLAARIIRKHFDTTPEVVAHFGDTLLAEADRLGQVVDEFLELARLESGLITWNEAEVDPADLIQRAVAEVESVAVSYGVSVAFTMEPGLPPMEVDRERIAQALTILLALSVRGATEASEIVVQIAGAHGGWVFTVGGASFVYPHAEARKVHARSDGSGVERTTGAPEDAGLGLCLCREIINRYQGRLWLEGAPGATGCARFTLPYKQHRRAAPASVARTQTLTRAAASPIDTGAEPSELDLELRREMAVQALRERAAVHPPSDTTKPPAVPGSNASRTEVVAVDAAAAASVAESFAHLQPAGEGESGVTAAAIASAKSARTDPGDARTIIAADEPKDAPTDGANARPRKLSFAHTSTSAQSERPVAASRWTTPRPNIDPPVSQSTETERPGPAAAVREAPERHDADAVAHDDAQIDVLDVMVPEIIDDSPVRAPVSGTMITAHQRTVGPPVLAHPGVPALSGVQSAANAAIHGSDELLLEIAEAQSSDGHSLVVSDEVRNLLATAPGTLPAVSGQNPSAPGGTRSGYQPSSRRRMVQAPWVVRSNQSSAETASAGDGTSRSAEAAVDAGQRARLSERLAKRLGLSSDPNSPNAAPKSGGDRRRDFLRSRRLG